MSAARSGPRAWLRTYAIALVIALAVTVSGLVGLNVVIERKIADIDRVPNLDLDANTDPGEPANFLLIGSDTRAFVETAEEEESFGDPTVETGQRSDTLMVMHVDPENRKGFLVSLPRDLVVEVPGLGEEKINAAYNAGPQRVIDTLKLNFDIPIHHYLEVDFASFKDIVDAVGGVPIHFDAPARDQETGLDVSFFGATYPGCFELDGEQALAFVRAREYEQNIDGEWEKDLSAPDLDRIERQQDFIRRMAAEAVAKSLSNPLAANNIANKALAELRVDRALSESDIFKLIQAFRRVNPNDPDSIETVTVPTDGDTDPDLGSVQILDEALAEPIFARLRELATPPAPADAPAPSSIRVRVLNGSGVSGAAADTEAALGDHDFQSRGTGNNPDGNVDETEIRYRPGSEDKAQVLQTYLTGGLGRLIADDSIVEADVTLVLGEDFDGVVAPTDAAPPASTAAPAPTQSSGGQPAEGTSEENTGPEQAPCG